jgi:hypothetical protein
MDKTQAKTFIVRMDTSVFDAILSKQPDSYVFGLIWDQRKWEAGYRSARLQSFC